MSKANEQFSRQISTATFILASCSVIGQFPLTVHKYESKTQLRLIPRSGVLPCSGFLSTSAWSLRFGLRRLDGGGRLRLPTTVGRGCSRAPVDLMRGTFMAPRMRVYRKHAIFELVRHGSQSVPGFPRKTALCHILSGGRQVKYLYPAGLFFLPHTGFSPLRLCCCASAFDDWVEVGQNFLYGLG